VFRYLSLLRTAKFEAYHQKEMATLSSVRFQFAEKRRPDKYATWIAEHMSWPLPPKQLLSGPQLIREWGTYEGSGHEEVTIRRYLDSFRISESRSFLMAKEGEHRRVRSGLQWVKEPWYGTDYNVVRFEEGFIDQVCCDCHPDHEIDSAIRQKKRMISQNYSCRDLMRLYP